MNPTDRLELEYDFLDEISVGGLGTVVRARHRVLNEIRALKVVAHADETFMERVRQVFCLDDPAVLTIRAFGIDGDGHGVVVTDYPQGIHLGELLTRTRPLALPLALEIVRQGVEAINALHRMSLPHGHLVPRSFMVRQKADGELSVVLVDLAVVRALGRPLCSLSERLAYLAPECLAPSCGQVVANAADLYSISAILFELLTGQRLHLGSSPPVLLQSRFDRAPRGFDGSDPDGRIPEPIRHLVNRGLAPAPGDRPSAQRFLDELDKLCRTYPMGDQVAELDLDAHVEAPAETHEPRRLSPAADSDPSSEFEELLKSAGRHGEPGGEEQGKPTGAEDRDVQIVANALTVSARSLVKHGDLEEAVAKLRKVQYMRPGHSPTEELLASTESALFEHRVRALRHEELAAIRAKIDAQNGAGELDGALETLALTREIYGPDPVIAELEQKMAPERDHDIGDHLAAARSFLEASDVRQAVSELREAGEHEPGAAEVQELMQDSMRRHAASTVARYLDSWEIAEAWRSLDIAEKVFGTSPELQRLRRRLQSEARDNTSDAVTALVTSARILADTGDHRSALQQLRRAGEVDPGNSEVREMTHEVLLRHAEATVEEHIEIGDKDDARRALSIARKRFSSSLGLLAFDLELGEGSRSDPAPAPPTRKRISRVSRRRAEPAVLKAKLRPVLARRRELATRRTRRPSRRDRRSKR